MIDRKPTNSGFTLIEITVVLFLVALLASAVAVSSRGMLRGATLDETTAQIGSLDADARRSAQRLGYPVELHLDTGTRQMTLLDPNQSGSSPLGGYVLPAGYELRDAWRMVQGERVKGDEMVVRYSPDGTSTTWGLSLHAPSEEEPSQASVIVVLGMTGQLTEWESDEQAQDIFAAARRHDAD